jgi:hypothetical protein
MTPGTSDYEDEMEKAYEAALASVQQRTAEMGGEDLPSGTRVVFSEGVTPEPARTPMTPKVVDLTNQPRDDMEVAAARLADRKARSGMAFERGTRELIAGLTRTPVQPISVIPTDAEAKLTAKRTAQQQREDMLSGRAQQAQLAGKKFDFDTQEAARRAGVTQTNRAEDLAERERDNARAERSQDLVARNNELLAGIRGQDAQNKAEDRSAKEGVGSDVPLLGGTLSLTKGLSDADRSKARDVAGLWNAADEAVANFQARLEEFAAKPSVETKGQVTAALRTASSAFNSAIGGGAMSGDEARAMSEAMGADVLSPSGVAAFVQMLSGDQKGAAQAISGRVRAARQANRAAALGRLKTYGAYSEGGTTPNPQRPRAADDAGNVVEWNGKDWVPVK